MVKFDVIFKSGEKLKLESGCFGVLNQGEYATWMINAPEVSRWRREGKDLHGFLEEVNSKEQQHASVRFYPQISTVWNRRGMDPWVEVEELINQLQWMKDVLVVRKAAKVIDVITQDNPADKVILALMAVRNLFQFVSMGLSYCIARSNGLNHVQAYVMSGSWVVSEGFGGALSCNRYSTGEYNHFDVNSFGQQAVRNMLGPDYNPWRLASWQVLNGYRRDNEVDHSVISIGGGRMPSRLLNVLSVDHDRPLFASDNFREGGYLVYPQNQQMEVFDRACQELLNVWPE